ncbi:PrgI family protein [Candidatus Nomurabacteria bacterium]|nr:PrgI family protein [Candidatus Kaiserbacteria bacterium]MCB9814521.1 PrgI family protein [Candidatus Nomurabacteria bacterium]
MRFEVPQFIDIEDKIFGPLTWRQFLYLGGGVGMAVVMFFTLPLFLFIFLGIPLALLAGALAFYPVNNRPFSFFLEAIYNYIRGQRLYLWRQKTDTVYKTSAPSQPNSTRTGTDPSLINPARPKNNIASLAKKLELQALQKKE